jgi:hypothetical protein
MYTDVETAKLALRLLVEGSSIRDSTSSDHGAYAALEDNANHKFSLEHEREQFEKFLVGTVRPQLMAK